MHREKEHPLFEKWPGIAAMIPLVPLGSWPTRVEPFRIAGDLDGEEIWIKREDLSSAACGGNKVRKLEFLLAGSHAPVLTFGPMGSHHVLSTAIHARALGRPCTAVLVPQHLTEHHRRVHRLITEHCERVIRVDRLFSAGGDLTRLIRRQIGLSKKPGYCVIAPGGSSPRGTLGHVGTAIELAAQVKKNLCPKPERIYVALGTGGTAAGLALGLALAGLDTEVVAVRVASGIVGNTAFLHWLARRCLASFAGAFPKPAFPKLRLRVETTFCGPGYAHPTREAAEAVETGRRAGIALETTYTGKTVAALLSDLKTSPKSGPVMLLHTYGSLDHLPLSPISPMASIGDIK